MKDFNKCILLIVISVLFQASLNYAEILTETIKNKKWDTLGHVFEDSSYLKLRTKFNNYSKLHFLFLRKNKIKYYIKYLNKGEMGFIQFKKKKGKYSELNIIKNFSDMSFIRSFNKIHVKNKSIQIGDARLLITEGFLYIANPLNRLTLFEGNFKIIISPNNIEEQKTLQYLFNNSVFSCSDTTGVFLFKSDIINGLIKNKIKNDLIVTDKDTNFIKEKLIGFQKEYGVKIVHFDEFWYAPFPNSLSVCFFKNKASHYKYTSDRNSVPDTFLFDLKKRKHILNYNRIKGMKFSSLVSNKVKKIQLYMRFNPEKHKIWSTALLIFPKPTNSRSFEVFKNMKIHDFYVINDNKLDYIRYGNMFHIIGEKFKDFSFYYSGKIPDNRYKIKKRKYGYKKNFGLIDDFIILDNTNKFYPNPGNQFFESTLKISLPVDTNCLASGFLRSRENKNNRYESIFKSDGTKGITVVCGKFHKIINIGSKIPINIFGKRKIRIKKYLKPNEIKESMNFLFDLFGRRDIIEINLLLRRWMSYGGISYKGFIIFNVVKKQIEKNNIIKRTYINNPVYLTSNLNRDNLVHELAHQWWGGIISWKTYKDVWITEGGAQFSLFLYLEHILKKKRFDRIIKKVIKKIIQDSVTGPILYGGRIENITDSRNSYQSLVYNKSAMVFLMLRDLIGETKLIETMNKIFTKYKNANISTINFIKEIIRNNESNQHLERFFSKWIYSREIPLLNYKITVNDNTASIFFEQKKTDFVFPIRLNIRTLKNRETRIVIVNKKKQVIHITTKDYIKSIEIEKGFSPVIINES